MELSSPKNKKFRRHFFELKKHFFLFQSMEHSSLKLKKIFFSKNFLYFRRETCKAWKQNCYMFLEMELSSNKIKQVLQIYK